MKAILIIDHGSRVKAANDMIFDVVDLVQQKNNSVLVVGAHMELASPTIEDGINECIKKGATHIIAQPFMLSPGRHSTKDIPNIVNEVAKKHPSITIETSSHFGLHSNIADIILDKTNSTKKNIFKKLISYFV